jgi:hypothetical protein
MLRFLGKYLQGLIMNSLSRALLTTWFFAFLASPAMSVAASSEADKSTNPPGTPKSIEEIARESSNPLAAFYRFDYEGQYRTYRGDIAGADDQNGSYQLLQASIPFAEKNGKGWLFRVGIPYVPDQPIYWADVGYAEWRIRQEDPREKADGYWGPTHGHTDNIRIDLVYGGVKSSGLILSYGIAGELPTTSDTSNGKQQLILGPALNLGKMTGWGVYGAMFSHVIDLTEKKDYEVPDTSITTIQGYLSYGLGNGWQLVSNPVISYDWEGDSGNKLNLPLGGGVAKTTMISKMPLKVTAEFQYFVASTDRFGPDLLFKLSLSPIMPGKHTRH